MRVILRWGGLGSLTAVVGAMVGLLVPSAGYAQSTACAPPSADTGKTVKDKRAKQGEVTEYFSAQSYRVTRCAADGVLLVSMTVGPQATPEGEVLLPSTIIEGDRSNRSTTDIDYPDPSDPDYQALWRKFGESDRARVIPPTAPPSPRYGTEEPSGGGSSSESPESLQSADYGCSRSNYVLKSSSWPTRTYDYKIRRDAMPSGYEDNFIGAFVAGSNAWNNTYNTCGFGDQANFASRYVGDSGSRGVHSYRDGVSVYDFGSMSNIGCMSTSLACARTWSSGGSYIETDQRYNSSLSWSSAGASNRYDAQNVGAHESGHSIGLAHVSTSLPKVSLTMRPGSYKGGTWKRTLGRGDILGMRAKYPG